ncbi:hypothetical protein ACWCQL_27750 [Streptomyces sp. NPDC002073]|uniref:hypothetical protein n=1 Tax=Streptomyces sp. NBC_00239 TaxID=2903640 RepID=UPI002E2CDC33|nr:hypothetical protein [Streptomyces sp. NBC_00239]
MSLTKAFRTALLTVAVAGAAVLGTQAAQADDTTTPAGPPQVTRNAPLESGSEQQATPAPSPTASHANDPWD